MSGLSRLRLLWMGSRFYQKIYMQDNTKKILMFLAQGFDEVYDTRIHELARKVHRNGGYIATMCVGVLPIADAGLLKGKRATTYPYSQYHDNITRLEKKATCASVSPKRVGGLSSRSLYNETRLEL